jgi:formylglycine-generating enzyme required for sulfatase activity/dienelactone hydrolase/tRNA A-37 threonylcarbamoyl transferase component Bud32
LWHLCEISPMTPPPPLAAALAGRYRLEREVGSGGMATVYLAEDLKHHRRVAIKVLKPELAAALGAERFLREIEITAALNHPHILPLYDSGRVEQLATLYYVMPYVEGESLRDRLQREGALPLEEALRVAREAADALSYAHGHGVIHRDIKPENILLESGHAVVADFGIARAISVAGGTHLTETGMTVGTPAYMSPEQSSGERDLDARSDLYSLGCVLYEMVSGEAPHAAQSPRELLASRMLGPPDLAAIRRTSPGLATVLEHTLAPAPADRFPSIAAFAAALDASRPAATPAGARTRPAWVAGAAVLGVVGVVVAWAALRATARERDRQLMARAQLLADSGYATRAFLLAERAGPPHANDSAAVARWDKLARGVTFVTNPPGARVSWRPYAGDDTTWRSLGTTPVKNVWLPRALVRLRLERAGSATLEGHGWTFYPDDTIRLPKPSEVPPGMVWVGGDQIGILSSGLEALPELQLPAYLVDRYEVTNRRFKAFVDAGGYADSSWWPPFERDGRRVPWAVARRAFVDRTGRPGPATWELGDYPDGQDDYPVAGVSWYEAEALARFSGRSLPSIYHWNWAAGTWATNWIVPQSNLGGHGLRPVGSAQGLGPWGTYDMAGNVREWCANASGRDRFILGGGWNDASMMFESAYAQSPWDRSATNGLRLVTYPQMTDAVRQALRPVQVPSRDYAHETPVSDEAYAVFRRLYAFDPRPLDARIEAVDTTDDWVREQISFAAAYGDERVPAYLYLPRRTRPPYQTVVYFPGSNALFARTFGSDPQRQVWDYVVKTGRALLFPVYWGTYERDRRVTTDQPDTTDAYRDRVVHWARDFRRAVEYAVSRPDLDSTRLAFLGYSWGGRLGPLLVGLEPRIKVAVLYVAGLKLVRSLPEADPFNYASRVKIPVLMLNGRYDYFFPVETSQIPLYRLLGSPPEAKRHVLYDGSHFVPRVVLVREVVDWLDRWLGPVEPPAR